MNWKLHYKLDDHCAAKWGVGPMSDELGYAPFGTRHEAEQFGRELRRDPEAYGHVAWLTDASIWAERIEGS